MKLAAVPVALLASSVSLAGAEPRTVHLWWADGSEPPAGACQGTPPPYECSFGADAADCRAKVVAILERWYGPFGVTFVDQAPATYTVVVNSYGGAWCSKGPETAGFAPSICVDLPGSTAYAFACDWDARACATIIAQEQAHLVGLAHTTSPRDVMYPEVCPSCDGFEDAENPTTGTVCRSTQNSWKLMRARLTGQPDGDAAQGGCGCEVSGQEVGEAAALALAILALALLSWRERRSSEPRDLKRQL